MLLIIAISACFQPGCMNRSKAPVVPPDFKYPAVGANVALPDPLVASRVSGRVLDPNGDPVKRALVEVTTPDWSERLSARFTDEHGIFDFSELGPGEYPIRVTRPGFAPLLAKIKVLKSAPKSVDLTLHLAT
jgi:hypothetical protein